jgi:hypothetical protein
MTNIDCPGCGKPVTAANEANAYHMHEDCWAAVAARATGDYIPLFRATRREVDQLRAREKGFGGLLKPRGKAVTAC